MEEYFIVLTENNIHNVMLIHLHTYNLKFNFHVKHLPAHICVVYFVLGNVQDFCKDKLVFGTDPIMLFSLFWLRCNFIGKPIISAINPQAASDLTDCFAPSPLSLFLFSSHYHILLADKLGNL